MVRRTAAARAAGLMLLALALLPWRAAAAADAYEVRITGPDKALTETIRQVSELAKRASEPAPPPAILAQRAERDRGTIAAALRALGYYDAEVEVTVDAAAEPPVATVEAKPGPRYTIADYAVTEGPGGVEPRVAVAPKALGVGPGDPAAGSAIVEAERKLVALYAAEGYPFAKALDRKVVIDRAAKVAHVSVRVDPGPAAKVGPVAVSGTGGVSEALVRRRIALKPGAPLTSGDIEKTRVALVESGLFSSVRIDYPAQPADPEAVPIAVTLTERPHHTIGAGVNYSTNFGPGVNGTWEDRNLFGGGERLTATARYALRQKLAELKYREPDLFGDPDQALVVGPEYRDEQVQTDTFSIRRFALGAVIERRLSTTWKLSYGVGAEESHVTRRGGVEVDEHLIGFPVTATRDTSDNLLNPTRGGRLTLGLAPYLPVADQPSFLVTRARQTWYQAFDKEGAWVAALWGEVGSVLGASRDEIPFSRRFYLGGGGSIRGYGYQLAGPVDAFKNPLGGASEIQFGTELRIKVTDTIGIVPFVEAGSVYNSQIPDFSGRLFVGAGLGARYYTAIGPVRVDVAVPLHQRTGIDDAVQFYISLGQAF